MPKIIWKIKKISIEELKEWDNNPRKLTKKGLSDLKKSISKFGLAEPLVVNLDNNICGGHGRKQALIALGIKEVDCYIPNRRLTEAEFKELNIRLNKNIAGDWDFDILNSDDFLRADLSDWGFEDFELGLQDDDNEEDDETSFPKEKQLKTISCPDCGHKFTV